MQSVWANEDISDELSRRSPANPSSGSTGTLTFSTMSQKETPSEIFKRALATPRARWPSSRTWRWCSPARPAADPATAPSCPIRRATSPGRGRAHPRARRPDGAAARPPRRGGARARPGPHRSGGARRSSTAWSRPGSRRSAPMRWAGCATTCRGAGSQASGASGLDNLIDRGHRRWPTSLALMVRERLTGEPPPAGGQGRWSTCSATRSRPRPAPTSTGWPTPSRTRRPSPASPAPSSAT